MSEQLLYKDRPRPDPERGDLELRAWVFWYVNKSIRARARGDDVDARRRKPPSKETPR